MTGGAGVPLTFAALLREYRVAAGLTQEALAERAEVSARSVSDLERAVNLVPHRDTVDRLIRALELTEEQSTLLVATITRQRGPAAPQQSGRDADSDLPTGVVTLLLTEINGSDRLWELQPDLMRETLAIHDAIVRAATDAHHGNLIAQPMPQDGRIAVFRVPGDAVGAAVEMQQAIFAQEWPAGGRIRVRLALHTGLADVRGGAYYGGAFNRCARLCSLASPGQTLMSEAVVEAAGTLPPGAALRELGEYQVSDHARPERVFGLLAPGVSAEYAPPRPTSSLAGHYETVLRALLDGKLTLFVGDSVNSSGHPQAEPWLPGDHRRPPAAAELADHLARNFSYPAGEPPDLSRVAQYISSVVGSGPLYDNLHTLLSANFAPTPFHQFVANICATVATAADVPRYPLIVSTAYDQGLERALGAAGESFDTISYIADGEDRGRFVHKPPDGRARLIDKPNKYLIPERRTIILKVHGAVDLADADQDSFVITEDNFLDYLVGGDISNLVPVTIAARLRRTHYLFLDYRLRDWNMRVILRRIWGEQRLNYKSWAVSARDAETIERSLWRDHGVEVLDIGLEKYLRGLEAHMRSNPAGSTPA